MALATNPLETFRALFKWDNDAGVLVNRVARAPNSPAGALAGFDNGNGYRRVSVEGRKYYTHQIVWALHYGELPVGEIDHIDANPLNNRIENLRLTDRTGNNQNTRKRAHSKQPYKGVSQIKSGRWLARIGANNRLHRLGVFDTPELAYSAYCEGAKRLHGKFARLS